MNKLKLKTYILQLFIILFLISILLTSKVLINKILVAIILIIYAYITKKLICKSKTLSMHKKEAIKYMAVFATIYIALYYVIGIYTGYYTAIYKFGFKTLINYIIPLILIIISSEIIRSEFLSLQTKLSKLNTIIFEVVVDLVVYVNVYNLNDMDLFLQALGYIFFASIVSNVLFNYICEKFGITPNIVYRIITTIYVYIIPFTPDVYIYFKSICRMIYPVLIYVMFRSVYEKEKKVVSKNDKTKNMISTIIIVAVMGVTAMLISCKFTYGMLVIGSGSMTGVIDKGDAIIYKSSNKIKDVKKGDIIVFNSDGKIIVHRVVKIEDLNNEIRLYTKGDYNVQEDPGYRTQKDLKGMVKFRVAKIGLPTIMINEFFTGVKRG